MIISPSADKQDQTPRVPWEALGGCAEFGGINVGFCGRPTLRTELKRSFCKHHAEKRGLL